jgi:lipoprotein signal peptidase
MAVTLATVCLIPVLMLVWWTAWRQQGRIANLAFGAVLGGAIGNAYDRVMTALVGPTGGYQGVRDFIRIDLRMLGIDYVWPNFNVADAAISTGFAVLVLLSLLPGRFGLAPERAAARGDH